MLLWGNDYRRTLGIRLMRAIFASVPETHQQLAPQHNTTQRPLFTRWQVTPSAQMTCNTSWKFIAWRREHDVPLTQNVGFLRPQSAGCICWSPPSAWMTQHQCKSLLSGRSRQNKKIHEWKWKFTFLVIQEPKATRAAITTRSSSKILMLINRWLRLLMR